MLDLYPYATTGPIYVSVGGAPIRSAGDAAYFVQWIDRLISGAQAYRWFNTASEREHVLDLLHRARAEFERRIATP